MNNKSNEQTEWSKAEIDELLVGYRFDYRFDGFSDIWEAEQGKRSVRIERNKNGCSVSAYEYDFGFSKPFNKWSPTKAQNWLNGDLYIIPRGEFVSALRGIHQISSTAWSDNYQDAFDQINEICGDILNG